MDQSEEINFLKEIKGTHIDKDQLYQLFKIHEIDYIKIVNDKDYHHVLNIWFYCQNGNELSFCCFDTKEHNIQFEIDCTSYGEYRIVEVSDDFEFIMNKFNRLRIGTGNCARLRIGRISLAEKDWFTCNVNIKIYNERYRIV